MLAAIRRVFRGPREASISEMLSDPIVQALMEAENVDPGLLERDLQTLVRHRVGWLSTRQIEERTSQ
jgi:hypothetical protein